MSTRASGSSATTRPTHGTHAAQTGQSARQHARLVVVDVDVLEEIRGMRADIKELSEKLAQSATRDELRSSLDGYVSREAFNAHVQAHASGLDARRWWATYGLGIAALALSPLLYDLLAHVTLAIR